jgi:hypothetical protein
MQGSTTQMISSGSGVLARETLISVASLGTAQLARGGYVAGKVGSPLFFAYDLSDTLQSAGGAFDSLQEGNLAAAGGQAVLVVVAGVGLHASYRETRALLGKSSASATDLAQAADNALSIAHGAGAVPSTGPVQQQLVLAALDLQFVPDTEKLMKALVADVEGAIAANPAMLLELLGEARYAALRQNSGRAAAYFGKGVELTVKRTIEQDALLRSIFTHTGDLRGPNGRFISSVDFIGLEGANKVKLDITTEAQRALKLRKYDKVKVITHHGIGNVQFP